MPVSNRPKLIVETLRDASELSRIAQGVTRDDDRDDLIDWLDAFIARVESPVTQTDEFLLTEIISERAIIARHARELRATLLQRAFYEGQAQLKREESRRFWVMTAGMIIGSLAILFFI